MAEQCDASLGATCCAFCPRMKSCINAILSNMEVKDGVIRFREDLKFNSSETEKFKIESTNEVPFL